MLFKVMDVRTIPVGEEGSRRRKQIFIEVGTKLSFQEAKQLRKKDNAHRFITIYVERNLNNQDVTLESPTI